MLEMKEKRHEKYHDVLKTTYFFNYAEILKLVKKLDKIQGNGRLITNAPKYPTSVLPFCGMNRGYFRHSNSTPKTRPRACFA